MTPVRDQGNEGTCVAFASAVGVKEYEDTREYKKYIELSPRYLYSICKKNDGAPDEEGTYPRVAMKMLLNYGVSRKPTGLTVRIKRIALRRAQIRQRKHTA